MKKIFIIFITLLSALFLGVLIALIVLIFTPKIVWKMDEYTLIKRLISQKTIDFSTAKLTLTGLPSTKRVIFEAWDLSFHRRGVAARSAYFYGAADLSLSFWKVEVASFGPIRVHDATLSYETPADSKKGPPDEGGGIRDLVERLGELKLEEVDLKAIKFNLATGSRGHFRGQGNFHLTGLNRTRSDKMILEVKEMEPFHLRNLQLKARIVGYKSLLDPDAKFEAQASVTLAEKGGALRLAFQLKKKTTKGITAVITVKKREMTGRASFRGILESHSLTGHLEGALRKASLQADLVRVRPCPIAANWNRKKGQEAKIDFMCEGDVTFGQAMKNLPLAHILPARMEFSLGGSSSLALVSPVKKISTDVSLKIKPQQTGSISPLSLEGEATTQGSLYLSDPKKNDFLIRFNATAGAEEFAEIVNKLEESSLAIPAPLNQLKGRLFCKSTGEYRPFDQNLEVPLDCSVHLRSEQQTVMVNSKGNVSLSYAKNVISSSLQSVITVYDLDFVLPTIRIGRPLARITVDRRIVLNTESLPQPPVPPRFSYDITLQTATNGAIRIHSNLLKAPLPLSVRTVFSSKKPLSGEIAVNSYRLDVLHRIIDVDSLSMTLGENLNKQPITGRARFDNNDYKITVQVLGTIEKPQYLFQSDPPLSQKELLGVLLFGKEPEFLESDKLQSLENTQAALADGMINLISMYYLASTPVESISYNPVSKIFSAKVNLAKGTSLIVGMDSEDKEEIGLRRNLGRGWSLETSATRDEKTDMQSGSVMLRWRLLY